ncbi:MAG: nitroreductase [Rhodothermales bacterium]
MISSYAPQNPWNIAEGGFPSRGSASQKLKFLLNYAVLAPSLHNTQPWSFRVLDDEVEFFADASRAMTVLDPEHRQLVISCGAALFNLRMAIKHYEHTPIVHTFPDQDKPHLLARVRIVAPGEATPLEQQLFAAIKKRRTHRGDFAELPLTDDELASLRAVGEPEQVAIEVLTEKGAKEAVGTLIAEGMALQGRNDRLRAELSSWTVEPGNTPPDLVPAFARTRRGTTGGELADWGGEKAQFTLRDVSSAPAIVVISTPHENRVNWLNTGQALSRLLLTSTGLTLSASFLNQGVEVPATRQRLAELVGHPYPQLVLRLGHPLGQASEEVPRQAVDEKIVTHALQNPGGDA